MSSSDRAPVVVAVADEHDAALRYAAAEAIRGRRGLRVVHVVPPVRGVSSIETMLITFEIVRASARTDVLVVGRRRSHGVVHLGSVVRAAVREARCPLIVVTPDSPAPSEEPRVQGQAMRS